MPLHITSIGSSFAAGPGIQPQVFPKAERSGANYAHLLSSRLGAKLTDLSVAGATLLNLLHEPQTIRKHTFPPQTAALPEESDIVLVLGGGNDLGYFDGILYDSIRATWIVRVLLDAWEYVGLPGSLAPKPLVEDEAELAERYGVVLDEIHSKAPKAHVFVVEYLTILGPNTKAETDVPFDAGRLRYHRDIAAQLQRATEKAVKGREEWCQRIPVATLSQEHGVGSKEPWIVPFGFESIWNKQALYHPNAEGMKAVAEMLYEEVKKFQRRDEEVTI